MTLASALVPEEPNLETAKPDRRILWLARGHVIIGLLLAFAAAIDFSNWETALALGLYQGQLILLGVWVGLGPNPMWQREIGVVAGIGYFLLSFVFFGVQSNGKLLLFFIFFMATAIGPFLIMRLCNFSMRKAATSDASSGRPRLSIFTALAATFVVAVMLAVAMALQRHERDTAIFFVMQSILTTFGVIQAYGVLGANRLLVGLGVTAIESLAFYFLLPFVGANSELSIGYAVAPIVVLASLVIVRSFGYRLVAKPSLHRRTTARIGVESTSSRVAD